MITIRRAAERGTTNFGWLDSRHTFAFGEYHDPSHLGFRSLRVINDDRVAAGGGFGMHPHRDMEIFTYVLSGALEHKDSMGTGAVVHPGELQFMRAGTGVTHGEFNASKKDPVHFLQIWILPVQRGLDPAYDQRKVDDGAARGGFALLASRDGRDGSIHVRQDVDLLLTRMREGESRSRELEAGRHAWVHVATGAVTMNGAPMDEGDGASVSQELKLDLVGRSSESEVLLFDLG